MSEKKFLLHVCCAPCAAGCIDLLREAGFAVTFYFSNSNLNSAAEYARRLDAVRTLARAENFPLLTDDYDHAAWLERAAARAREPEGGLRCRQCFAFALERAARTAAFFDYPNFATSLTVSPHKNSAVIFELGAEYERFMPLNFKKKDGFLKGIRRARALNLYRQNYCGCEFSVRS